MTQKITRKRALELAQECIRADMMREYPKTAIAQKTGEHNRLSIVSEERYAELAAALAWLEAASRQKEMHL